MVAVLLIRLLWLLGWALALPLRVVRRLLPLPVGTYIAVEIDGPLDELPRAPRWWPPRSRHRFSLHELGLLVDAISKDPRVAGLLVIAKSVRGGFAAATSLRGLLLRARSAGKKVVVHLPLGGGTKETYFAVAADRLLLGPRAHLAPLGVLASTRYVRGALDRAGLVPEVYARGRYKTAAEQIERRSMSEAQREQLEAVLEALHGELVRAIADGRRVHESRARAIVDGAPYFGEKAHAAGLADAVAYEDELRGQLVGDGKAASLRRGDRYMRARRTMHPAALRPLGAIGVVRIHGAITGATALPLRTTAVEDRVIAAVRLARANPSIRGVLVHIDSPGGSALASDRIHHELVLLAADKPLVACMGNVAASGGYYVSVAANEIVAQPTTITGSIGVVSARLVLEPLLERLGITTQVLQRGAHARLVDPFLPLDEPAKQAVIREIDSVYEAFVEVVARGRNRSVGEVEPLAQGRVWTGAEAQRNGLVDRLGGFDVALNTLRTRIGRGADKLPVVVLHAPRKVSTALDATMREAAHLSSFLEAASHAFALCPAVLALGRERVLAWSPAAACVSHQS